MINITQRETTTLDMTRKKASAFVVVLALVMIGVQSTGAVTSAVPVPVGVDEVVCQGPLASQLCTAWTARYDGPLSGNDIAYAIAVAPDGAKVYVTGKAYIHPNSNAGYATAAYDARTGEEVWVAHFEPAENGFEFTGLNVAYAIDVSPDGEKVFITGKSRSNLQNPDQHYDTIAYDAADGTELWVTRYDGPGAGHDIAHDLVVSPDGTMVFVTGQSPGDGTFDDFATAAYDTTDGSELWVARYDGPLGGNDVANAIGVSPDGSTVIVTGQSPAPASSLDYVTIAYDARTGDPAWTVRYDGTAHGADVATDLLITPDGTALFVTGHSVGTGTGADYTTVKYDPADGTEIWTARYDGPVGGYDVAAAITGAPDGAAVYVTGSSPGDGTGMDFATVANDAVTGEQLWVARNNGEGDGRDGAWAIGASPDGTQVFVTGDSYPGGADFGDSLTVAYAATDGSEAWNASAYNVFGLPELGNYAYDRSEALVVHPDSSLVYVAGFSWSEADASGYNWQTIAYGAVTPPSVNVPVPDLPIP